MINILWIQAVVLESLKRIQEKGIESGPAGNDGSVT
jgi:hypothetical protein